MQCASASSGNELTTSERILDDGEAVVEAEFALVLWDPDRASRPITDDGAGVGRGGGP